MNICTIWISSKVTFTGRKSNYRIKRSYNDRFLFKINELLLQNITEHEVIGPISFFEILHSVAVAVIFDSESQSYHYQLSI